MTRESIALAVQWAVATALGIAIAHLAADLVWFSASSRWLFPLVPYGGATLGIPTGVLQWLVLRTRVPRSSSWILATAAGWAGSWAIGSTAAIVIASGGGDVAFFIAMACGAPMVGFAQRHFLREWSSAADSWPTASTVAWIAWLGVEVFGSHWLAPVSAFASRLVSAFAGYETSSSLGASLLGGLLLGAITGVAMTRALQAPGTTKPHGVRLSQSKPL